MTKVVFANYEPDTGRIRGIIQANRITEQFGLRAAAVRNMTYAQARSALHVVDLDSIVSDEYLWDTCELIPAPSTELTVEQIRELRRSELNVTDQLMAVPEDHPERDALLARWKAYRKILRELGAANTVEAILTNWPAQRPDGTVSPFREQLIKTSL